MQCAALDSLGNFLRLKSSVWAIFPEMREPREMVCHLAAIPRCFSVRWPFGYLSGILFQSSAKASKGLSCLNQKCIRRLWALQGTEQAKPQVLCVRTGLAVLYSLNTPLLLHTVLVFYFFLCWQAGRNRNCEDAAGPVLPITTNSRFLSACFCCESLLCCSISWFYFFCLLHLVRSALGFSWDLASHFPTAIWCELDIMIQDLREPNWVVKIGRMWSSWY